jgi:hypothetical protein
VIFYRTSGTWGPGTGANLTAAQVDGNFYDVAQRVQFLELNPPAPIEITSFNAVGDQLYINMSDGTVQGPLTLPAVRWFFRGVWTPNTNYSRDNVVTGPDNAVYLVLYPHVSAIAFEPAANDGQGHNYYSVLLRIPASSIPVGGAIGDVLTKNTNANFDLIWDKPPPPPGGNAGDVLQKNSEADGDASWNTLQTDDLADVEFGPRAHGDYLRWDSSISRWVNHEGSLLNVLRESSWAPVVGDNSSFMVLTNGAANANIIIPNNDTEPFAIGTELHIHQDGTGTVSVVGEVGVTILKHASFSNQLLGQYATATVKKTNFNEWRLFGLLAGA